MFLVCRRTQLDCTERNSFSSHCAVTGQVAGVIGDTWGEMGEVGASGGVTQPRRCVKQRHRRGNTLRRFDSMLTVTAPNVSPLQSAYSARSCAWIAGIRYLRKSTHPQAGTLLLPLPRLQQLPRLRLRGPGQLAIPPGRLVQQFLHLSQLSFSGFERLARPPALLVGKVACEGRPAPGDAQSPALEGGGLVGEAGEVALGFHGIDRFVRMKREPATRSRIRRADGQGESGGAKIQFIHAPSFEQDSRAILVR